MLNLIIYGVFDRWANDRCVMVGSTIKPLVVRAKGYKRQFNWYEPDRFEHRPLWQGEVVDDELLHFLRAAKEAVWIGRMQTWHDEGGFNQMNPVSHALHNENFFSELCAAGGRHGKGHHFSKDQAKAAAVAHSRKGPDGKSLTAVKAGKSGRGECKARRGEKHPYFGKQGPRLGMKNSEAHNQKLRVHPNNRNGGILTNHRRWHEARGIISQTCNLCRGESCNIEL